MRLRSRPWRAAAQGADQVAAYCEAGVRRSGQAGSSGRGAPPTTSGQHEDPGQGHGKGGPPTTT